MKLSDFFACRWPVVVCGICVLLASGLLPVGRVSAAEPSKEDALIAVLESDAPPAEKAITCKRLAIYGTERAVPSLAKLLPDPELTSWARIALEAIPGAVAEAALRDAMDRVEGRVLVGVINSIAYRRDAQAVPKLIGRLGEDDPAVVSAAAVALGRIGGAASGRALVQALDEAPPAARSDVALGCILCAETFAEAGQAAEAMRLYAAVQRADVPKQRKLEALRGTILARGTDGLPFLLEALGSADKDRMAVGLAVARELEGASVTTALAEALDGLSEARRPFVVMAIADRKDAGAAQVILRIAGDPTASVASRIVAVEALERLGDASCVPVLVSAAASEATDLSAAAKATLLRLAGADVDAALQKQLGSSSGRRRAAVLELLAARHVGSAVQAVVGCVADSDAEVRGAAVDALGELGGCAQVPVLTGLFTSGSGSVPGRQVERALRRIAGREGADCVGALMPLMKSGAADHRAMGLRILGVAGGPKALAAVRSALQDREAAVRNEAVRVLSTWPNNWPHDAAAGQALLALARSGRDSTQKVLGLRGYLQYLRGNDQLAADAKVAQVREVWPLVQRREEKQLVVAVLSTAPTGEALALLKALMQDAGVREEACAAIVNVAGGGRGGLSAEVRREALRAVLEASRNETTKKRANEALRKL